MNSVISTALKFQTLRCLAAPLLKQGTSALRLQSQNARTLVHSAGITWNVRGPRTSILNSSPIACNCTSRLSHTKAEDELVEFLTEEIIAERKAQKSKTIPTEIDGFKAQLNGAEVTFTKDVGDKTLIKVHFNVNHSVDTEPEADISPEMEKPDFAELKSKPTFKIDLVRNNTTVSLVCSFISADQQDEGYNDIFGIDEISIYNGDWNENVYSVSGEVVDSYLYDLLLNYLDEKGITNEFVEKLSDYSTAYEHSAYIGLLEGLSKFAAKK